MAPSDDLRDFLATRRARISPERAGLVAYGRRRRVEGLRREEVAMLAGISVEYYTRLERGRADGVSDDVLRAVSRALQLDDAEQRHLRDLVRVTNARQVPRRKASREPVRPIVKQIVDALVDVPAYVRNGRLDVLYANRLGEALYAPLFDDPARPVNVARFVFLNPASREFYVDWNGIANDAVAILRMKAGEDPYDQRLIDLVGELSTRSSEFATRWATHDVKISCGYVKVLHHPVVGDLTLAWESLRPSMDDEQRVLVYTAEPGTASQEALALLASWSATPGVLGAEPWPSDR